MDRDAKIRYYAKFIAKVVLIIAVLDAAGVGLFLVLGSTDSISTDSITLALSLMMILMGIGIQGIALYQSGGLPALYFGGWATGVLLVAIGSSLSHLSLSHLGLQGVNLRSLASLIFSWAFFMAAIGLNFVAARKLTRPK